MKKHLSTIFLVLILVIGLSLLLYPSFANWWNTMHSSRVVSDYTEQITNLDDDQYLKILEGARDYNRLLNLRSVHDLSVDAYLAEYNSLLNVGGSGIMGYIEIPVIDVMLPIYHGTSEGVLQIAVGHLDWTSLPVGGESTHCVLSGHRGLPSAKLFTDLDKVVEGDVFMLYILDEVLTYQVDQIQIVEPHESESLQIINGEDLCTLVTCTPYGINTHRMLVRGRRIDTVKEVKTVRVTADAFQIEPIIVAPFVAAPILLILLIILMLPKRRRK